MRFVLYQSDATRPKGAESSSRLTDCWGANTYLVLDEKLDTLNGSSSGLRDGSGNTTHCTEKSVLDICKRILLGNASLVFSKKSHNKCRALKRIELHTQEVHHERLETHVSIDTYNDSKWAFSVCAAHVLCRKAVQWDDESKIKFRPGKGLPYSHVESAIASGIVTVSRNYENHAYDCKVVW